MVIPKVKPTTILEQPLSPPASPEDQIDPALFVCPITREIMTDPVFCSDGNTYERLAISQWIGTKLTSPMTNQPLEHKNLTTNHMLRSSIIEWQERQNMRKKGAEIEDEAEEARKAKEAEEARKAKEAEEARKAKEAEEARKAKEAEEARKAKEAEEARKAKEAEEARKA